MSMQLRLIRTLTYEFFNHSSYHLGKVISIRLSRFQLTKIFFYQSTLSIQLPFKQRYFHPNLQLLVNKEFFNQSSFHLSNVIFIRLSSFDLVNKEYFNLSSF